MSESMPVVFLGQSVFTQAALIASTSIMSISEEAKLNVFRYFVSDSIFSQIFAELLSLKDICRFDSAICNKQKNQYF
jgi:hypothetical protein